MKSFSAFSNIGNKIHNSADPLEGSNKEQGTINPVLHTINQKQSRLINDAYGLEIKFDLREPHKELMDSLSWSSVAVLVTYKAICNA
jgi:hypothetical protein